MAIRVSPKKNTRKSKQDQKKSLINQVYLKVITQKVNLLLRQVNSWYGFKPKFNDPIKIVLNAK